MGGTNAYWRFMYVWKFMATHHLQDRPYATLQKSREAQIVRIGLNLEQPPHAVHAAIPRDCATATSLPRGNTRVFETWLLSHHGGYSRILITNCLTPCIFLACTKRTRDSVSERKSHWGGLTFESLEIFGTVEDWGSGVQVKHRIIDCRYPYTGSTPHWQSRTEPVACPEIPKQSSNLSHLLF